MPQGSNEGANSPLSPVSGAPTEVPTDCGGDDASREGDLAEEPTLVPELPATVPDSLLASGVGRFPPPTCLLALPVPGDLSRRPLLRSSASCSIGPMARQLATELTLPFGDWLVDWLVDALYCWLQEAREEAKIYKRAHGYHSGDLAWINATRGAAGC